MAYDTNAGFQESSSGLLFEKCDLVLKNVDGNELFSVLRDTVAQQFFSP